MDWSSWPKRESVTLLLRSFDIHGWLVMFYVGKVEKPTSDWTAYFVELTFPSKGKYPFKFTTVVRVTPDTLPYPPPEPGKTHVGPKKQTD